MKERITPIIKWVWSLLVISAVLFYLFTNRNNIAIQLAKISIGQFLLAHLSLIAGKLILVEISRESIKAVGWQAGFLRMLSINSYSQLAKYLPGGIWQFVGRAGYYTSDGLPSPLLTRAMLLENSWLVTSAVFFGSSYLLPFLDQEIALTILGVFSIWLLTLLFLFKIFSGVIRWRRSIYLIVLQLLTWFFMGLSFFITIPNAGPASFLLSQGAFALSWAIGFLAIFAPGGFGVREFALGSLLSPVLPNESIIVGAGINRVVWIITEILLGLVSRIFAQRISERKLVRLAEGNPPEQTGGNPVGQYDQNMNIE